MPHTHLTANPFALMMTPEAVFAAIERSERLGRLNSRICRPLDGPRLPQATTELSAFDEAVDASAEPTEPIEASAFHESVETSAESIGTPVLRFD